MKEKPSCMISADVVRAIRILDSETEQLEAYNAYVDFAQQGKEYEGDSAVIKVILEMARPAVEAADKNYWDKVGRARKATEAKKARKKEVSGYQRAKNTFTESIEKSNTDYDAIAEGRGGLPLAEERKAT